MHIIERHIADTDWVSIGLMILFVVNSITYFLFTDRLHQLASGLVGRNYLNQILRDGSPVYQFSSLTYYLGFVSTSSLLLTFVLNQYYQIEVSWRTTLTIVIYILAFLLFKNLFSWLTSYIFETHEPAQLYRLNSYLLQLMLGIVLLPVLALYFFSGFEFMLQVGMGLMGLYYLMKILRGMVIGLTHSKFPTLYLFLYLCTLEILPLLLIVKAIQNGLLSRGI